MDIHSREFLIEQTDKTIAFQKVFQKSVIANTVKKRVFNMVKSFAKQGRTEQIFRTYQKMDKQIKELAKGAVSKVGKKRFGYMCNPDMTLC